MVSRNVDVGQTVAATMQAPTLFVLAEDLTHMQVNASIDESDIGRSRPGQPVAFQVDAYPNETFHGTVRQVRLDPVVDQNVVSYVTVIDVAEPRPEAEAGDDGHGQRRGRARRRRAARAERRAPLPPDEAEALAPCGATQSGAAPTVAAGDSSAPTRAGRRSGSLGR